MEVEGSTPSVPTLAVVRWHQRSAERVLEHGHPKLVGTIHAHADYRTGTACGVESSSLRWANMAAEFDVNDPRSCRACVRVVRESRLVEAEARLPEHGPFRI